VVGSPEAAAIPAELALAELGEKCGGITVPRGVEIAHELGQKEPGQWDLMCCGAEPPTQTGEDRVTRVEDLATVQAFLDRVNPHHPARADHPEVERWLGVADEETGAPPAIGAFTRRPHGIGHLASIATAPEARGRGLGAAVSAALTRHAFAAGDAICALAHFHSNAPARRLYLRLGYRTTHQLQSAFFARQESRAA
jgi:ribosomal protein S18 acetylase RimI-like enzyme